MTGHRAVAEKTSHRPVEKGSYLQDPLFLRCGNRVVRASSLTGSQDVLDLDGGV